MHQTLNFPDSKIKSRTYPLIVIAPSPSLYSTSVAVTITVAGGRHRGSTALIVCPSSGAEFLASFFILAKFQCI
ncbi:hypothetical protein SLE2022_259410 [Rubroshorea leprosula]